MEKDELLKKLLKKHTLPTVQDIVPLAKATGIDKVDQLWDLVAKVHMEWRIHKDKEPNPESN